MRARNVKPGFFDNEYLAACEPLARLLFIGLWCAADRDGRLEDRPMRLKKQLLGYDNCDCDALLHQLATHGNEDGGLPFITRYAVDGKNFIQINNFSKHQHPHVREPESTIPPPEEGVISTRQAPDKHGASMVQAPDEHGTGPADSLIPITDSLINTHTSCSGEADIVRLDKLSDSRPCPHKEIIELYHELLPELPKIRTWPEHRKKALKSRWKEDSSRQSLDWWRDFFLEKVKPSDFLCGRVNEWTASLDWIILPKNFAKVLDGFYVRDGAKKNGTNGHHTETEAEREARLERYRSYANA